MYSKSGLTAKQSHGAAPILVRLEALSERHTFVVAGVAAIALAIRFWNFGSLGYQHWDEFYFLSDAQTVSRLWPRGFGSIGWVTEPLVAYTDGTLFHFLGNIIWIPLAVSAVYGTLSCIALYFLGSRMFGPGVGLIAAAIVATSEFSAMFSRMAIADATFDFWLIAAALFIWLGFERRRLIYYVLAGVSAGILLNAKYDGIFALALAASWLLVEFLIDAFRRTRPLRAVASEYNARLFGTWVMVGLAIVLFIPFFEKVAIYPGWRAVLAHAQSFGPNSLIRTSPLFIVWYFWLFTSPPTVILASAGLVVGLFHFTRADRFLLIYTSGWFVAVLLFAPYPREALSLLPAVAIWAGRAIVEAWRLANSLRPRTRVMWRAVAALSLAVVLIAQAVPLSHMLSLRTNGYADAGAVAASYQAGGDTIFTRTQAVALLYLKDTYFLDPTPAVIDLLNAKGSSVVFMTDQALSWYPAAQHLFDLNRDRLQVIDRVPNPLYGEVLLQPATQDGLAHINDPPDSYRYITFWRVMAPLAYPSDWPS